MRGYNMVFDFFDKIKKSFKKIRTDITDLRNSMNEWVLFLNSNQTELKKKVYELDRRLRELEMERVADMMNVK